MYTYQKLAARLAVLVSEVRTFFLFFFLVIYEENGTRTHTRNFSSRKKSSRSDVLVLKKGMQTSSINLQCRKRRLPGNFPARLMESIKEIRFSVHNAIYLFYHGGAHALVDIIASVIRACSAFSFIVAQGNFGHR